MTLYEMNQAGYGSLKTLTELELYQLQQKLVNFIKQKNATYYMMLNHDIHYFTLYTYKEDKNAANMAKEIMSIVRDLGDIKAIELSENNEAIEFWIVDMTGNCNMYALFNYDEGVVIV